MAIIPTDLRDEMVSIDMDVNPDGHLASVTCVPDFMSNDRAILNSRHIEGAGNAYCVRFQNEAGGVFGDAYETCISENGNLFSMDKNQNILAPAWTGEGKKRIVTILAQTYDCNELNRHLLDFVRKSLSQTIHRTVLPVDIDQDDKMEFPPTVGIVTVGAEMVDDLVLIGEPIMMDGKQALPLTFFSELPPPYGDESSVFIITGAELLFAELLFVDGYGTPYTPDTDMTRFWENLGNILNGYFSRPSDFAASLVSEADKIAMPEKKVLKADSAEEQKKSALQVFKESMQRGMEASEAYDMGW